MFSSSFLYFLDVVFRVLKLKILLKLLPYFSFVLAQIMFGYRIVSGFASTNVLWVFFVMKNGCSFVRLVDF